MVCVVEHHRLDRDIAQRVDVTIDPGDLAIIYDGRERRRRRNLHRKRSILVIASIDGVMLDPQVKVDVEVNVEDNQKYEEGEK